MASTRDDLNFFFFKQETCQEDVEKIGIVNFCFKILEKEERDNREKKIRIKRKLGKTARKR